MSEAIWKNEKKLLEINVRENDREIKHGQSRETSNIGRQTKQKHNRY